MGRMIDDAVAGAGLDGLRAELPRRLASGGTLSGEERERLGAADLLVVGALADEVRKALVGDRVQLVSVGARSMVVGSGVDFLREVAIARLSGAPIAIDVQAVGLHLAQIALGFGADTWIVGPGAKRSLTGMSLDLEALIRRAGRIPEWVRPPAPSAEVTL
jgi:hypothetical protein